MFKKPIIISVGASYFYQALRLQTDMVVHVEWRPPAGGDREVIDILRKLKEKLNKK
jgi:hypothetical protein